MKKISNALSVIDRLSGASYLIIKISLIASVLILILSLYFTYLAISSDHLYFESMHISAALLEFPPAFLIESAFLTFVLESRR